MAVKRQFPDPRGSSVAAASDDRTVALPKPTKRMRSKTNLGDSPGDDSREDDAMLASLIE